MNIEHAYCYTTLSTIVHTHTTVRVVVLNKISINYWHIGRLRLALHSFAQYRGDKNYEYITKSIQKIIL